MAKHHSIVFFCLSFILASTISLLCDANDEDRKLHIVYMGSLPERAYSLTSHHLSMLQQVIDGSDAANSLIRSYQRSFNGFAAKLTDQQREKLAQMEGVVSIFPSKTLHPQTTRSWDFMGFGESIKRNQSVESDVVIGVIDSGIWPESESFSDESFGPIPKKWNGTCAGGDNFTCNKKIIGARYYASESARDEQGHGSHTASTAAGNNVGGASFYGLAQGTARGGVPSARIAAYKVCSSFVCSEAGILSAFDDAIADGVDIITISIGQDFASDFTLDTIAIGSFHAMERGILTVNSVGNNGPEIFSVSSVAPWMLSVAASSIDRQIIDKVVLGNGEIFVGDSVNSFASNGTKFPIALDNGASSACPKAFAEACDCLNSNLVTGKIVLCSKVGGEDMAYTNGAIGSITKKKTGSDNVSFVTPFPVLALNSKDYDLVQSYTNSTKYPQAEILKSEIIKDGAAPRVVDFSSRGPNFIVVEIMKPDISAPGVEILAAYSPIASPSSNPHDRRSVKYNIMSGTSMACPHVAGVAAYLKTFHPDWSPAAIKSAIMTTARSMNANNYNLTSEYASGSAGTNYTLIGEFAFGSGHVNPVQAIDPGLVYDISKEDYIQMLCNFGYDATKLKFISGENSTCPGASDRSLVKHLNYPALVAKVEPKQPFTVRFNRTVTNVGFSNSTYKVTVMPNSEINVTVVPEVLSFKSLNEKQSFVVTVVGGAKSDPDLEGPLPVQITFFSSLVWSDGTHNVRSPIVVL